MTDSTNSLFSGAKDWLSTSSRDYSLTHSYGPETDSLVHFLTIRIIDPLLLDETTLLPDQGHLNPPEEPLTAVQHEPAQLGSGRPGPSPDGPVFPESRRQATGGSGTRAANRAGGSTIGRRVARILALPAAVILILLGLLSAQQINSYRNAAATSDAVALSLEVQNLVTALQTERGVTAAVQGGNDSFTPELSSARAAVDTQRQVVKNLVTDDEDDLDSALDQLDGLSAIRASTDAGEAAGNAERTATFDYYTERIDALTDVDLGLNNSSDGELRQQLTAFRSLQQAIEGLSSERALLNGVFSAGGFSDDEFLQMAEMRAEYEYSLDQFEAYATTEENDSLTFIFSTGAAEVVQSFEQTALDAADGRHVIVNPQSWWSGMGTLLDDAEQLEEHVGSQIQLRAHDLQQAVSQRIGMLLIAVLICFAGSIYLSRLAAQSITRPLAGLAGEANDLAARRLPEAVRQAQTASPDAPPQRPDPVKVPDRATDEIRSVAKALDRLQGAAYELATEQAEQRRDTIESLANLGRRNQNLIRRQLGFITSLEREEVDPNSLANLFELDHLATRMRRNAASLLVLVDASSPRTWSQPVPVADVIRAAVSEVEEYRRVALRRVDDANVVGSAIGSIAHLLSELIENGLTFSPPDSEVEVQGRRVSDGYLIAITDQGVGMSPDELRLANSRLRGEGDFIAAPTRFLGHFVVGKLARDTGVHVQLLPSPVTGVTARITLPASLLAASLSVEVTSLEDSSTQSEPPKLLALPRLDGLDPLGDDPADRSTGLQPTVRRAPEPGTAPGGLGPMNDPQDIHDAQVQDIEPVVAEPVRARDEQISAPRTGSLPQMAPPPLVSDRPASHRGETDPRGIGPLPGTGDPVAGTPRWAKPGDLYARQFTQPEAGNGTERPGSGTGSGAAASAGAGTGSPRRRRDNPLDPRTPAVGISGPPGSIRPAGSLRPEQARPTTARRPAPAAGPAGPVASERTQNGLRKRVPRNQRQPDSATRSTRRVIDLDAAARTQQAKADSPADVSARLTALRAGMRRGQSGSPQPATSAAHRTNGPTGGSEHQSEESR